MKRFLSFILSLAIIGSTFPANALVVNADEFSDNISSITEDSINESSDKDNDIQTSDNKDDIESKINIKDTNVNDKKDDVIDSDDIDKNNNVNVDEVLNDKNDDSNSEDNETNINKDEIQNEDIQDGELEKDEVTDGNDLEGLKKLEEAEPILENPLELLAPVSAIKVNIKVGETEKPNPEFEGESTKNNIKVQSFDVENSEIVYVKKDAHRIHITGLKAGETTVTVTGENGSIITYNVTVTGEEVEYDDEITIEVGKESGTKFPFNGLYVSDYSFNSEDGEVDLEWGWGDGLHTRFTVTGIKSGTTYLTLKHNNIFFSKQKTYKINVIPGEAKYYVLLPDQTIDNLGKEESWQYVPNNSVNIGSWNANTGIPGSLYSIDGVLQANSYGLRDINGFGPEYVSDPDEMGKVTYNGVYYDFNSYDIAWYKIKYHKNEEAYHVDGYIKGQPVEVAYQWNGKTVKHQSDTEKIYSGNTITLAGNEYTKFQAPSKEFVGWNVIDGDEKVVKQPGDEITVINSMIITPVWEDSLIPIEKANITYKYGDIEYTDNDGAIVGEKYSVKTFKTAFPDETLPQNKEFADWKVIQGTVTNNITQDGTITVTSKDKDVILEAVIKEIPTYNVELAVDETKVLTAKVPFDSVQINAKTEQEKNIAKVSYTSGTTFSITGAKQGTTQVVLKQDGKIVEIYDVTVIQKPVSAEIKIYYWVDYQDGTEAISRYNDVLTPSKTSLFEGNKLVYEYKNVEVTKNNISNLADDYLKELGKTHNVNGVEFSHYEILQYPTDYIVLGEHYQGGGTIYRSNEKPINNINEISDTILKGKTEIRLIFNGNAKNYTITYKSNLKDVEILNMPNQVSNVKGGEKIALPTTQPSSKGYKFLGWFDEQGNKVTSENVMPAKDITLTAKFEKLSYLVSYKSIDVMDMQTSLTGVTKLPTLNEVTFGSSIKDIVNGIVPEKHGYNFLYWRYNGSEITNQSVPTSNIELVAHFERSLFNVNYSYQGVAEEDKGNIKNFPQNANDVSKGTQITLDSPTLKDYHFIGWFDEQGNKVNKITVNKDYNLTAKFAKDATIEYVFYSLESGEPNKDIVIINNDDTYEGVQYPVTAEDIKIAAEKHLADNKINNFRYLGEFQVLKDGKPVYYSQDSENSEVKNFTDLKLSAGKNTIYVLYQQAHNITINYIQIDGENQTELGSYQINDVFNKSEVEIKEGFENNAGFISNNYLLADGYKFIKATLGDNVNGETIPNPFTMGKNNEVINVFYAKDNNQWKNIDVEHIYNSDRNIDASTVSFSESKVINQNYEAAPIAIKNNVKYVISSVTVNGVNAQLIDGKIAGTITDNVKVIFTYDVDANEDGVADKNQATFTFKSADEKMGKVVGKVTQVVNNENGKTFKVTSNVTTIVEAGYKFSNWTAEVQGEILTFENLDAVKASEFLGDVTFTANFEAVLSGGGGSNRPNRPSTDSSGETTTGGTPVEVIEIPELPTPLEKNPVITTTNPYIPSQQTTDVIVDIEDEDTPLAEKPEDNSDLELIEIEDETVPLTSTPVSGWALVNLIMAVFTVLSSILLLFKNKNMFKTLSIFPAIVSVIAFILTENITNPMVITDKWTLMMCVITLIQVVVIVLSAKGKKNEDTQSDAK